MSILTRETCTGHPPYSQHQVPLFTGYRARDVRHFPQARQKPVTLVSIFIEKPSN
jgi:hypothetical protein